MSWQKWEERGWHPSFKREEKKLVEGRTKGLGFEKKRKRGGVGNQASHSRFRKEGLALVLFIFFLS